MKTGLILFAHGARDPRWAQPFEAVLARVQARAPALAVRLAFLEIMSPDLNGAADDLVREGCSRIEVLPLFLGIGGHLRQDLPPMLEALRARHAGLEVHLHGAAGAAPSVIEALAAHAIDVAQAP